MQTFIEWLTRRNFLKGAVGAGIGGFLGIGPAASSLCSEIIKKATDEQIYNVPISKDLPQLTDEEFSSCKKEAIKILHKESMKNPEYKKKYDEWKSKYLSDQKADIATTWEQKKQAFANNPEQKNKWLQTLQLQWKTAQEYAENPNFNLTNPNSAVRLKAIDKLAEIIAYSKKGFSIEEITGQTPIKNH